MIYIVNNQDNTITTDNTIDYVLINVSIYLDDTLIGEYVNDSSSLDYIVLSIPSTDLIDLENQEYDLKLINADNGDIIKTELAVVSNNTTTPANFVDNNTKNKFYE